MSWKLTARWSPAPAMTRLKTGHQCQKSRRAFTKPGSGTAAACERLFIPGIHNEDNWAVSRAWSVAVCCTGGRVLMLCDWGRWPARSSWSYRAAPWNYSILNTVCENLTCCRQSVYRWKKGDRCSRWSWSLVNTMRNPDIDTHGETFRLCQSGFSFSSLVGFRRFGMGRIWKTKASNSTSTCLFVGYLFNPCKLFEHHIIRKYHGCNPSLLYSVQSSSVLFRFVTPSTH